MLRVVVGRETDDLLPLIAAGSQHAFTELYDRTSARLLGVIRSVLRDLGQSEEVAQEVYLDAWRFAARYDPQRGSVMAWLTVIARNRAIDRVRSSQASASRTRAYAVNNFERDPSVTESAAEIAEQGERLRDALGALSSLQREAITLTILGGLSYPELSLQLGVPLGTVKTRIRDGLMRMKQTMAEPA